MRVSSRGAAVEPVVVVALGDPVVLAVVVASRDLVAQAGLAELAAQEVRVELVVLVELAALVVRVAAKPEHARVAVELELVPVEAKLEHGRVEVELAHVQVAAPAKIKSVTAAPRHGQVPVPKRVEDLAAAVVVAVVAVVVAVGAVVVEDAGDKRTIDQEKTNEIKNKYYDFVESFRDCLRDR
jgi:hypothetical protein